MNESRKVAFFPVYPQCSDPPPPSFLPWCHVLGIIPSLSYVLLGICHNRTTNTLNCPNYPGLQLKWYRKGEAAVYRLHHPWVQPWAQNPDCNSWERRDHKQIYLKTHECGCDYCEVISEPERLTQSSPDLKEGSPCSSLPRVFHSSRSEASTTLWWNVALYHSVRMTLTRTEWPQPQYNTHVIVKILNNCTGWHKMLIQTEIKKKWNIKYLIVLY